MVMNLFLKSMTRNKFALIHVSLMRMCNRMNTKASLFQQYLLCLILQQNAVAKTIENYVFSSLNISGVRKCKYSGRSYPCLLAIVNSEGLVFR